VGVAGLRALESVATARERGIGRIAAERVAGACNEPFTVRSGFGRLLEVRVVEVLSVEDIASLSAGLAEGVLALAVRPFVFCDCRSAPPFSQAVADQWSRDMRGFNDKVVRSAILLSPDNETFNLQLARVVRCAGSTSRRLFSEADELRAWLCDLLTDVELARVDQLLRPTAFVREV
jgi:hypothetical protein